MPAMAKSYFDGVNDIRVKPRLLASLLEDRLPDAENRPLPSPSDLSAVVSAVKTHGLLYEVIPGPTDEKLAERWRSSVDAWVERCLSLLCSKLPDKCWAGICLLGVTSQECSSDRFLASYSLWFLKLVSKMQSPAESHFVKVACCSSLADLFTRLGGFASVKKDGTSLAGRLVQPIINLLAEETTKAVLEGCVDVLCTLITFFPSCIHRHYDNVEAAIASKILSRKCNVSISKNFSQCLALLPKSRGDEDSWSLLLQKMLILINAHLNVAFQGLEAETKGNEFIRLLVPPGKATTPPPLGGQLLPGENLSDPFTNSFQPLHIYNASALLNSCCMMLTNPYPVQVSVPIQPLIFLIERILMVDGSLYPSMLSFTTVTQQEFLCLELPVLHSCSLDLLISVIKGVRSQLLPHASRIAQLLGHYSKRCVLASLRVKVYSVMRTLLFSMGAGMALYLAQDMVTNAFADLRFPNCEDGTILPDFFSKKIPSNASWQSSQRKRKHVFEPSGVPQSGGDVSVGKNKRPSPLCLQIAALQALEALITVGGALRSENWRSDVDRLLIMMATDACDGGWTNEKQVLSSGDLVSTRVDFQLAAFQALLASFLSPGRFRPSYLSQGLELFRRGKQETGTKLAEFCSHALLTLEVLIHPRALPLHDFSTFSQTSSIREMDCGFLENTHSGGKKPRILVGEYEPENELFDSWLGNDEQIGANNSGPLEDEQIREAHDPSKSIDLARDEPMREAYNTSENVVSVAVDVSRMGITQVSTTTQASTDKMGGKEQQEMAGSSPCSQVVHVEVMESRQEKILSASDVGPIENTTASSGNDALKIRKDASDYTKGFFHSTEGKELRRLPDSDASSPLNTLPDLVDAGPDSSDEESE